MIDPAIEPLKKKLHNGEREIEALECKVQQADLRTAYPQEYAEFALNRKNTDNKRLNARRK